jgi:hypothetical protein
MVCIVKYDWVPQGGLPTCLFPTISKQRPEANTNYTRKFVNCLDSRMEGQPADRFVSQKLAKSKSTSSQNQKEIKRKIQTMIFFGQ